MFLGKDTSCFSFVFWFLLSINRLQTVILYLWHFDCLDIHFCLSDEWFPQLVALMTPPEDTFIDRKSFKSLLASHLRFLSPEMKVCILFKCKIEFQDMSPLAHPGLQNHYRTAVNSHIKKFWKELKSFPRLSTVLCRFEKKNILRVWDILYFGAKGRGFLLCAARF